MDDDRCLLQTAETRVVRSIELRLREPAYLPIRTAVSRDGRVSNDDFAQGADPMLSVLAAMDGLMETEECRVEIALQPMAHDWSKYWRGATSDVGERAKLTPTAIGATLLMSAGAALTLFGLLFLFGAILLHASLSAWLLGIGLLAGGGIVLYSRFRLPSPPDPILIKQKINATAFRALIRLTVHATSAARVAMYLDSLVAAYRAYNLAGGNGFVAVESSALGMVFPPTRTGLLRMFGKPWSDLPILNTAELAALWHLPHGEAALQGTATTTANSLLPMPSHVTDTGGADPGSGSRQ